MGDSKSNVSFEMGDHIRSLEYQFAMSYAVGWAMAFSAQIAPLEKFVLIMLAGLAFPDQYPHDPGNGEPEYTLPQLRIDEIPKLASNCVMTVEKIEPLLERLRRKGLIRKFAACIELCMDVDPLEWSLGKYRFGKPKTKKDASIA